MNKKGLSGWLVALIVVVAISLVFSGFYFYTSKSPTKTCDYTDLYNKYYNNENLQPSEGWDTIKLKDDIYGSFFPASYKNGLQIFISDISVEGRSDVDINLGSEADPVPVLLLDQRRALYGYIGKDPTFKIFVEQVAPQDYDKYITQTLAELESYKKENINVEKLDYKGVTYYTSIRNDLSNQALKDYSSIGGVYIFDPLFKRAVFMDFYNTKYCGGFYGEESKFYEDEKLISKSEMQNLARQLIDSVKG